MTKPLNTQNEWIILTLIGAVAGFFLVSLDVKGKYTNQSHEPINVKSETSPLLQIHMHHQMWIRAPTPTPYAPPAWT